jgi:hypothetical protein
LKRQFQENHKILLEISNDLKGTLQESLFSYYDSLTKGDLPKLSPLMTKESYLLTMSTLGFKRAFRDESFKYLLEKIETDSNALLEVEEILSHELKKEARKHIIKVLSYEPKGPDRVTLRYTQDTQSKKIYFSNEDGRWKIDLKAGRQKDL